MKPVLALVDNFCWPDPVGNPANSAALVRACYGLRDAALALQAPLVSGKDSMKNDFRGKKNGQPVTISVPPTLLMTAVAKTSDVRTARTADFKACLATDRHDKTILASTEEGQKLGVTGTPTFFDNGRRMVGARSEQQFDEIIQAELR